MEPKLGQERLHASPDAKRRLAEAAFALLVPGETVFLDASSMTFCVARLIARQGLALRVVTNSLPVLQELADADVELVAVGGTFRPLTCSFVGPAAVRSIRDHFADRVLMSVTGVTSSGVLTDVDPLEAEAKRVMLEHADRSLLALDASNLGARGRQAVARVDELSLVLADAAAVPELEAMGAAVQAVADVRP